MPFKVSDFVSQNLVILEAKAPLQVALGFFSETSQDEVFLVIDENQQLRGIITEKSLIKHFCQKKKLSPLVPLKEVASSCFSTIFLEAPAEEIWSLPHEYIVVVDAKGSPVGTITKAGAARTMILRGNPFDSACESKQGVTMIDAQEKVTIFNAAAEEILSIPRDKILGTPCLRYLTISGLPRVLRTGLHEYEDRMKVRRKLLLVNRTPVIINGAIKGALAIFNEIPPPAKKVSGSFPPRERVSMNFFMDSLNDLPEGTVLSDSHGKILAANKAFAKLVGTELKMLIGSHLGEIAKGEFANLIPFVELTKSETSIASKAITTSAGKKMLVTGMPIKESIEGNKVVMLSLYALEEEDIGKRKTWANNLFQQSISSLPEGDTFGNIVAASLKMKEIVALALRLAQLDTTLLITGESGVGKEILADFVHASGPRRGRPFVKINCGAIPENLLESELFGYEPGAFTGADKKGKAGMFEVANQGTIFLDEISELPLQLQVKLLRVLQNREVLRLGAVKPKKLDVRVIAATNRDLRQAVREGRFREDLFYRLFVIPIYIPPLRERKEDIIPLAQTIVRRLTDKYGVSKKLSPAVLDFFQEYTWPGNVRELENVLEYSFVTSPQEVITLGALPTQSFKAFSSQSQPSLQEGVVVSLKEASIKIQVNLIEEALAKYHSITQAAYALGVHPATLSRKIKKLGIR